MTGHVMVGQGGQWSDYTAALQEKGLVSRCAIYGLAGRRWASTDPNFLVHKQQLDNILHGFEDDRELRCSGLAVADVIFTLTRVANRHSVMTGRCAATGAGCVIYRCRRCLLVAIHEYSVQPGACYQAVERLGDFLLDKGY